MRRAPDFTHQGGGLDRSLTAERRIGQVAAEQYGVVARRQLIAVGLTERSIDRLLRTGPLYLIYPGVYAAGYPRVTRYGSWMAAVLAGGPGAALSHYAGSALWEILVRRGRLPDVTVRSWRRRTTKKVNWHVADLPSDEVTRVKGIPVTTAMRTVVDLAAHLDRGGLERLLRQIEFRRIWEPVSLSALLERHPTKAGTATLRAILADRERARGVTGSHLEDLFLRFLAERQLPMPELNAPVVAFGHHYVVDCIWRDARLVAELDGRQAHLTEFAFDADRKRDRILHTAGWTVVRITWEHLRRTPAEVDRDLRALLSPALR